MKNLAAIRKAKGFTQATLAQAIGVSQAHISRLERGDDGASLKMMQEVAKTLGVDLSELFESRDAKELTLLNYFRNSPPEVQRAMVSMAAAAARETSEDGAP